MAQKGGMEALVDSTLARWFPPETLAAKPAHVERVRAMILTTPVNGFIGGAAALSDHDYNAGVATVTRPVLFVAGSKDGVTAQRPVCHWLDQGCDRRNDARPCRAGGLSHHGRHSHRLDGPRLENRNGG